MNKEKKYESIPLNLNQGMIRVTWEGMPDNLINQIVAIWSSHKEVLAIMVDWRGEMEAITKACPLDDPAIFYCDHFHIDTWDKRVGNSNHKAEVLAAVDVLGAALQGGSNYWMEKFKFVSTCTPLGEAMAHDDGLTAFKNGMARVTITEIDGDSHELKRDRFIKVMNDDWFHGIYESLDDFHKSHDAEDADRILQQALFGEVIYG